MPCLLYSILWCRTTITTTFSSTTPYFPPRFMVTHSQPLYYLPPCHICCHILHHCRILRHLDICKLLCLSSGTNSSVFLPPPYLAILCALNRTTGVYGNPNPSPASISKYLHGSVLILNPSTVSMYTPVSIFPCVPPPTCIHHPPFHLTPPFLFSIIFHSCLLIVSIIPRALLPRLSI